MDDTTEAADEELLGVTPIDLGAALFALHDPHPGHERDFNRYYERDHMYAAALLAPFTIAGQRWVATRELKQLRYPEQGPFGPATAGSYLTMFWIQAGHLAQQQAWVSRQMRSLVAAGRVFDDRDVQIATVYDYVGAMRRDADGVPPFMALDHRFAACVWMMFERDDAIPAPAFQTWLLDDFMASWFAGSPVALAAGFTPRLKEPWWPAAAPEVEGVGRRVVVAAFVETDVASVWTDRFVPLGPAVDASGQGHTLLVAPFIPTRPGTDTYIDQLR
jgi:hypothetical protein